jgi:hypothetical protein
MGVHVRVCIRIYPQYHCFLEAGKDPAPSDEKGGDVVGYSVVQTRTLCRGHVPPSWGFQNSTTEGVAC